MTDKEVMQMALDVLANNRYAPSIKETTEALRAALAQPEPKNDEYCPACDGDYCIAKKGCVALIKPPQPEPEPMAWGVDEGEGRCISLHDLYFVKEDADHMAELKGTHAKVVPLYTAPPQREWQGLTDEEIMSLLPGAVRLPPGWVDTVRAIEAKLKEKNT
jgi:hypothetical protein